MGQSIRTLISNGNLNIARFNFLFIEGNDILSDVIDFTADMKFVKSNNVSSYDVYINNNYYGSDVNVVQITTNDVLRIQVTK